jgi:hypothetical protein
MSVLYNPEHPMSIQFVRCISFLIPALLAGGHVYAQLPVINDFSIEEPEIILGASPQISWDVSGSQALLIDRGVGNVSSGSEPDVGSVNISPFAATPLVPRGSTWVYLDNGSDQGSSNINAVEGNGFNITNWKHPDYAAIGWSSGPAPLGYGDASSTVVLYGPNPDNANNPSTNKYITTYFRHAFNANPADLDLAESVYLDLQRDDGAIVYLNGEEIARSQIGDGGVGYLTTASSAAGADRETTFWRYVVDSAKILPGNNILAVEIHQANITSSDIRFDLEFALYRSASVIGFIPYGADWKYRDDGSDLGPSSQASATAWFGTGFDDSSWSEGPTPMGYDSSAPQEATVVGFGPNAAKKYPSTYFRNTFQLLNTNGVTNLNFSIQYDDGMIGYLNGVEIIRENMAAGDIAYSNASAAVVATEASYRTINVAAAPLIANGTLLAGDNVLAVEIHQANATSSDISLDVILTAVDANTNNVDPTPIVTGSTWHYLDDGSDQGSSTINAVDGNGFGVGNWKHPAYDDSTWASGPSELGYGDGPFSTALQFGPDPLNKPITTYFRTSFEATQPEIDQLHELVLNLQRDDGAVVYLNGRQVAQANLPLGTVSASTTANLNEFSTDRVVMAPSNLVAGVNYLAVEVHQVSSASNGLVMDAELTGNTLPSLAPVVYTLRAINNQGESSATTRFTVRDQPTNKVFLVTSVPTVAHWGYRVWSDGLPAGPGKDYVVYGHFASALRAGSSLSNPVFPGDSLELNGSRAQLIVDPLSGKLHIERLILNGGTIVHGVAGANLMLSNFGKSIEVQRDSQFDLVANDSRILEVAADLFGVGGFSSTPLGRGSRLRLTGYNRELRGDVLIQNVVEAEGLFSLGTGHITIDGGQLIADYNVSLLDRHLEITGGSGTNLTLRRSLAFNTATIANTVIAPGRYTASVLTTAYPALVDVITDEGGELIIGGTDSDGDNLLDAWEAANLGVAAPPTLDSDLDGLDSATEYAAGTDPQLRDSDADGADDGDEIRAGTDPSDPDSRLFITNLRETNTDVYSFDILVENGREVQIRTSPDLVNWTGLTPNLIGNATGVSGVVLTDPVGFDRLYIGVELVE